MNFLNKKIINFEDRYVGIDLSELSFKVLQLEKRNASDYIRAYSLVDIPNDYFADGRILDKKRVAELIKKAINSAGPKKINTKKAICSLPESKIFLRIITIPHMEKSEIEEAIKWEIEASIPLSIDQIYYDWRLIGNKDNKLSILTVAVSRDIADDILEVLELANLEVVALESESIAAIRSLIQNKNKLKSASLIVDLGSKITNFIVAQDGIPFFTSSIPFSSEGVTDAIAKSLGIDNKDAEKIKLSQGLGQVNKESSILNSMQSYLESLAMEIEKSIDFYQSINGEVGAKIKKIIICGGGSNLKGLLSYLTKRLAKEVSIGDPWVNLDFGNNLPIINKDRSTQFSTAVGLAMYKDFEGQGINLLPKNKKEALARAKRFKLVLGWELIISFIVLCFFSFLFSIGNLLNLNLATISDSSMSQSSGTQYEMIKYYEDKFSGINSDLEKIITIDRDQLYWSRMLSELASAATEEVEITDFATKNLSLYLAGHAKTRESMVSFKGKLEQLGCFSQVNLPISNLASKDNVNFQMDLTIKEECLNSKQE
ncbi:MAG: type IV pilus assembly protein PilM [Candidatus Moraniibacteriota bacterium]